jgi:hypothetical protein
MNIRRTVTPTEAYWALVEILDHFEHDEERHYKECSAQDRRNHIYRSMRLMRKYLLQLGYGAPARSMPATSSPAHQQ